MDPVTGLIAASVITGIINIGTSLFSTKKQTEALDEGQREASALSEKQEKQRQKEFKQQSAFAREQLTENKRQFDESMYVNREQTAYNRYKDRAAEFGNTLAQNENLKDLFINRIAGLRR